MARLIEQTLTVPNAGTESDALDCRDFKVMGLYVPTLTSATVSLQGSYDGVTWSDLKHSSVGALAWDASTGNFWLGGLDAAGVPGETYLQFFEGVPYLRVKLGAAQGAARTFRAYLIPR